MFLQNYYWFKKMHPVFQPTDDTGDRFPHLVDHMYKECLHNLRPKLKLFKSYDKSQEEVEKLRVQFYPKLGEPDEEGSGLGTINENESEDYTSEAMMESSDDMKPRSEVDAENSDVDEEENSQMDDKKSQEQKPPEKSEEDIQFEAMFEKMAADSYQERIKESSKVNTRDIPVPMTSKVAKKTYEQLQENSDSKQSDAIPFVLMVRNTKSGKQQFKNFAAPLDSDLAVNLKMQEQKIKEENETVKRLTLGITERLEEEDYQVSLQQNPFLNKKPKYKPYKHQFGVPDTDNIFH